MGRYSRRSARRSPVSPALTAGQRVLDVGSGPGALTAELVDASARRSRRRGPVGAVRRGHRRAHAGGRVAHRRRRGAAVRRRGVRRHPRAAGGALHARPGSRLAGDGPGDPSGAASSPPASGTTPGAKPTRVFWQAGAGDRPEGPSTSPTYRAPARDISSSCPHRPCRCDVESEPSESVGAPRRLRGVVGAVHPRRRTRPAGTSPGSNPRARLREHCRAALPARLRTSARAPGRPAASCLQSRRRSRRSTARSRRWGGTPLATAATNPGPHRCATRCRRRARSGA